ncbi:hypothetical protein [Lyngbya aestuarii]|uniref:hypothetical protein n=1 Tax=Lyngbya aestuarii TaxID=118322 RepID=UPI00403DE76E
MPLTRILLLVLVVGGLALFALYNWSPVLPLVFLGMKTPTLPVAVWIGGAITAGALTSLFLQLLSYLPRNDSPQVPEDFYEVPPQSSRFHRKSPPADTFEEDTSYTPPPPKAPSNRAESDWEESVSESWEFEEEVATSKPEDFEKESPTSNRVTEPKSFEVQQKPKGGSQEGSVYSYSYRKPSDSGVGKTETVYDANYRVITPPYQPPEKPEVEEDEEDWGFEDEEDFHEEVEKEKRQ